MCRTLVSRSLRVRAMMLAVAMMATSSATGQQLGPQPGQLGRHAEVQYKKFWTSTNPSAPVVFASALNVTCGG